MLYGWFRKKLIFNFDMKNDHLNTDSNCNHNIAVSS